MPALRSFSFEVRAWVHAELPNVRSVFAYRSIGIWTAPVMGRTAHSHAGGRPLLPRRPGGGREPATGRLSGDGRLNSFPRPGGRRVRSRPMALLHAATLTPTKAEVIAAWLPAQAWAPDGDD